MRKLLSLLLLAGLLMLGAPPLMAQNKVVSGVINSSNDNKPLLGVTINVKGTARSITTDQDGRYSINAEKGSVLVFSYAGYASQEVTVGDGSNISLTLRANDAAMNEVVVTAYGIRRDKRSLAYSTQVVNGEEIAQTRRENFINSLAGRVAGATVTASSGAPGASTQIILRGATSMGGNNQPLFVVDGVIYDNQTVNQENLISGQSVSFANRNSDYGNRAGDINPNDIESVTILKGPEATALYGADGASGAIVITTKKGRAGRTSLTYDNSFRYEKLYRFPKVQTTYNIGKNGVYDPLAIVNPYSILGTATGAGIPAAFGPRIPDSVKTYDNINSFFQSGFTQQHNIGLEGGTDQASVRLSTSFVDQTGVVPNTGYKRFSTRLSSQAKILNRINAFVSVNYINSDTRKATKGAGGYLLNLATWPVTNNVSNYINPDGTRVVLRNAVLSNQSLEYDNPFWDVYKNPSEDKVDRLSGNITLSSDITKWFNLSAIMGIDYYSQTGDFLTHPLSRFGYASNGFISLYEQVTRNFNPVFRGTITKNFGKLTNSLVGGFAFEDNNTKLEAQKGERFYERDFKGINNTDPLSQSAKTTLTEIRKTRFFGNLVTGYNNMVFISLAGSREGDSRFMSRVVDKNPFFNYGSASASVVFTDLFNIKTSWLNYGKARISYATTGKGPYAPYVIDYRFVSQPTTGGGYAYDVTGNNFSLEPERTKNLEIGGELRLFNSRVTADIAYYQLRSEKQLIPARSSYGTGFVLKWFNGGLVENKGLEVQLTVNEIKKKNLNWSTTFNFDRNRGTVLEMPADLPTYYDSDTWVFANLRSQYFPGAKIGNLAGNTYLRNNAGQLIINPTSGLPIKDPDFKTVGDRQPDFKLGIINNLTVGNFDISFNLDLRKGGDVFNATEYFLYLTGYSTLNSNRETTRVIDGVLQDGLENSPHPTKNTIAVTPLYNSDFYSSSTVAEEDFVENVNWLRLRDFTIAYTLPTSFINRTKVIRSASVFVTGTDLFMITNYTGADPSVNANNASNRGFGGAGIDYGSISVPRGINAGIRIRL